MHSYPNSINAIILKCYHAIKADLKFCPKNVQEIALTKRKLLYIHL